MILDSRRTFFKNAFLGGAVLIMCGSKVYAAVSPLQTIKLVQYDLFPRIKSFEVDAKKYLLIILDHSKISDNEKRFLRNGVQWLNQEALKIYNDMYVNLASDERERVLQEISKYRWGESWIESLLTYTMEALFSDKVYGVNNDAKASEWLGFEAGYPRPKEPFL